MQLLEEEAEEADKTLREANEKYVAEYYTFKSLDYMTWRCLLFALFSRLYSYLHLHRLHRSLVSARSYSSRAISHLTTSPFIANTPLHQAPTNRRQGRPLRAESPGPRVRARPVGEQVRGDGQEVRRHQEGARGVPGRDWQHLRVFCCSIIKSGRLLLGVHDTSAGTTDAGCRDTHCNESRSSQGAGLACDGLWLRAQFLLIGQRRYSLGGKFKSHWHCCDRSFLFPAVAVLLEDGLTAHFENGIR